MQREPASIDWRNDMSDLILAMPALNGTWSDIP